VTNAYLIRVIYFSSTYLEQLKYLGLKHLRRILMNFRVPLKW